MTTTLTSKMIANRAARRDAEQTKRANVIIAKVISTRVCAAEDDFIVDSADRKVRVTKATDAEIATFLRGNRVVDTCDILEAVGETAFNNMIANGSLIRDASFNRFKKNNRYWVAAKAAEVYGIPARVTLAGGATVALA